MNVAGIVEAGFIPKCIAMIFLLRMQMLSILLPSEEENLNKEVPKLPFSEHLMVARRPQRLELPVSSECPMSSQHCHYQNFGTLCPFILQLVLSEKARLFHSVTAFYPSFVEDFPPL